jgi:hypothetical protein
MLCVVEVSGIRVTMLVAIGAAGEFGPKIVEVAKVAEAPLKIVKVQNASCGLTFGALKVMSAL